MKYFYKMTESEPTHTLWTVGYEDKNGNWFPDSDWNDQDKAANRAAWLNGNKKAVNPKEDFSEQVAVYAEVDDIVGWAEAIMSAVGTPDQSVSDQEMAYARRIIETQK